MDHYKSLDSVTVADVEALGIPSELAGKLHQKLTLIVRNYGSATPQTWHHISKEVLIPNLPFSFHQMMYYGCYKDFEPDPPAWLPDPLVPLPFIFFMLKLGLAVVRHVMTFQPFNIHNFTMFMTSTS